MDLVSFLEFIGMVFSILGAFLMSRNTVKMPNAIFYGFCSFVVSNVAMLYVASEHKLGPLFIQMIFFAVTAIMVIKAYGNNKYYNVLYPLFGIYTLVLFINMGDASFVFRPLDMIAAFIAVTGSFVIKYKKFEALIIAFTCYFLADVLYVYIAVENSMWFFMCQSLFFWYTSLAGIANTLKTNRLQPSF